MNDNRQYLDAAYEAEGFEDLADAPVSALEGLSVADASALQTAFNIKTIRDLAESDLVLRAQAITKLANVEADHAIAESTVKLAQDLDLNVHMVDEWVHEVGVSEIGSHPRIEDLESLREQMLEMFSTREASQAWLNAPSMYLGWLTPAEVIRAGRVDRVQADLNGLAAGIYQ